MSSIVEVHRRGRAPRLGREGEGDYTRRALLAPPSLLTFLRSGPRPHSEAFSEQRARPRRRRRVQRPGDAVLPVLSPCTLVVHYRFEDSAPLRNRPRGKSVGKPVPNVGRPRDAWHPSHVSRSLSRLLSSLSRKTVLEAMEFTARRFNSCMRPLTSGNSRMSARL